MPAIDSERIANVQDRIQRGKALMLLRGDDRRRCEGVKDATKEKDRGNECQQECTACLYEAIGA